MNTDNIIFVAWLLTWLPAFVKFVIDETKEGRKR